MAEPARHGSAEMVLAFLAEAGDKLGLSRAAVWKHVDALRAQGYRIDAIPARGYRLVGVPDRLGELELRPLINTHEIGHALHWFSEVGSTNDVARALAEEGAAHGEVVIAESQTAGRGRRGRAWISPPGRNIYLSVILRPDLPPARAPHEPVPRARAVRAAGPPRLGRARRARGVARPPRRGGLRAGARGLEGDVGDARARGPGPVAG